MLLTVAQSTMLQHDDKATFGIKFGAKRDQCASLNNGTRRAVVGQQMSQQRLCVAIMTFATDSEMSPISMMCSTAPGYITHIFASDADDVDDEEVVPGMRIL